ncbi:MAG: DUF294 nucleotidyltransferase-like domain-containing protein, partial [Mariprofundaceae bacterium]|nr:DUF294 nucleotidyltransferase-like domain-containing protein [Mariprofundaceae bacterium]
MDDSILQQCLQSRPQHTENIIRLFKCSPFFCELMQGATEKECFQLLVSKENCLLPHQLKQSIPIAQEGQTLEQMMAHVRQCKRQGLRHIIWWELGLGGDVLRSASSLAHWADQFLQASIQMAKQILSKRFGHIEGGRFCIIGLGKMGGMELNLGSDIDPIFIWEAEEEAKSTGTKKIDARDYYARLSRMIIQLMSERSKDGIVWPMDMRLRPHGSTGPICLSLEATLMHYQYYGQTWERAMLIKARPSAGDLALGDDFIEGIQPFIYRRYLDYTTVQALSEMKERIDANASQSSIGIGFDVKRGRGGIREIEFIIQSLQLLHARKKPQLKIRNSMHALKVIQELGLLSELECQDLKQSYCLWRSIEHALQARKGEQTHNLAKGYDQYLYQARQLEDPSMIMKKHADVVQNHFSKQFSSGIKKEEVMVNWLKLDQAQLQQYAPQNIDISTLQQNLTDIRNTLEKSLLPERSQSQVQHILHLAMQAWLKDTNLFLALQSFCQLLKSISGRATWIDLLAMHKGARTWLIGVLSASRYIASHVASNPQWLEWPLEKEPIANRIEKKIRQIHDVQGFDEQSIMQIGQHIDQVRLNCALAIDAQLSDAMQIASWLSDATDSAVQKVLEIALQQLGLAQDFGFVCLAMGKHGSREMGLVSDLDMVFVLSHDDPAQLGPKNRNIRDWSQRLGRRMIQLLTLQR